MKRFSFLNFIAVMAIALAGVFTACNTEDVDYNRPSLDVSKDVLSFGSGSGDESFTVTSNRKWTITIEDESANDWLVISPMSSSGNKTVQVSVIPNDQAPRSTRLTVSTGTVYEYITVTQYGEGQDGIELYYENVGATVSGTTNIADFSGWSRQGFLDQSAVVYTGSGSSVRNSGGNYQPVDGEASGAPYVYMSFADNNFIIQKINITGYSNLTYTMNVAFQEAYSSGPVPGVITSSNFRLSASIDGNEWAEVPFTAPAQAARWVTVTSEFKVPEGSTELYIRLDNVNQQTDHQYRFDDFTVTTGGNGDLINVTPPVFTVGTPVLEGALATGIASTAELVIPYQNAAGTETYNYTVAMSGASAGLSVAPASGTFTAGSGNITIPVSGTPTGEGAITFTISGTPAPQSTTVNATVQSAGSGLQLYYEDGGNEANLTGNTNVDQYQFWTRGGILSQSGVTYSGNSSVRKSGAAYAPDGNEASGAPWIYMAYADSELIISNINVTGYDNLTFTTNVSFQNAYTTTPQFGQLVSGVNFRLSASLDGNDWAELPYSVPSVASKWAKVSAEFKVPSGTSSIYIRIDKIVQATDHQYRFDDLTIVTGGNGQLIDPQPALVEVGEPYFTGTLMVGTEAGSAKIVIPYTQAKGTETYNYSVAVSGAGSTGISVQTVSGTFAAGDGTIELPVSGTPGTEGAVTFTISGTPAPASTSVNATVIPSTTGPITVWEDDFSNVTGTSELSALSGSLAEFPDAYVIEKTYANNGSLKFSTGTIDGSLTTPALSRIPTATANLTVTFKADAWQGKTGSEILITIENGGTASQSVITLTSNATGTTGTIGMSGTEYTFDVTGATPQTTIKFSINNTTVDRRFLLDDLKIVTK